MLIAATDYDGTLCINGVVAPGVLDAIRQWRARGNRFGIVTGRDRDMTLHPAGHWGIPFDFLICCNGAAIYDQDANMLAARYLEDAVIADVLRHPAATASLHFELCHPEATLLHVLHPDSWFPRLGTPFRDVTLDDAMSLTSLLQIGLAYPTVEESKQNAAALNAAFGRHLRAQQNGACIDITPGDVDKAQGLRDLLNHFAWPEENLLVIGDGGNDIPMLKRYNGFTVPNADAAVKAEAKKIFDDVGAMLTAHMV